MKNALKVMCALTAVSFAGAALADHHELKVGKSDKHGSYIADAKGMALYTFKKDSKDKSACSGECVTRWPLYHAEKPLVSGDLKADDFGTITREDGKKQTTYKHMPLYYFAGDKAPGDTSGHGVKDVWDLAKP